MNLPEAHAILDKIRSVIEVTACKPPPDLIWIEIVERRLEVAFPDWLRAAYRACNGFLGPTGVAYLYPLDGDQGVVEFTLFLREQEWSPSWLKQAVVFGENGLGGSLTTHWAALEGKLIEWCYGDGAAFTALPCDLFAPWRAEQQRWDDALQGEGTKS